jgi:hypothetical protein
MFTAPSMCGAAYAGKEAEGIVVDFDLVDRERPGRPTIWTGTSVRRTSGVGSGPWRRWGVGTWGPVVPTRHSADRRPQGVPPGWRNGADPEPTQGHRTPAYLKGDGPKVPNPSGIFNPGLALSPDTYPHKYCSEQGSDHHDGVHNGCMETNLLNLAKRSLTCRSGSNPLSAPQRCRVDNVRTGHARRGDRERGGAFRPVIPPLQPPVEMRAGARCQGLGLRR